MITGYHGRRDGRTPNESPVLYLAPEQDYADEWSDYGEGTIYWVEFDAERPLHITTAEQFRDLWLASGADLSALPFHPNQTSVFAAHCKSLGHDAVVLEQAMFEVDNDDDWEWTAGVFGNPQTLILTPDQVTWEEVAP